MPLIKKSKSGTPIGTEAKTIDAAEPTVNALLADLQSPYAKLRRDAARGLGRHPETADVLCRAVAAEAHESVREAMFTALIRIGTMPVAAGLVPLLNSENAGLRNGAIEVLKTMPDAVGAHIGEIFASSVDVRIFGVEILGALGHPDSARWLIRAIEEDNEINVCAAAVDALAECGDQEAVAPLHRLLERFPDEPFIEFCVHNALARIASVQ